MTTQHLVPIGTISATEYISEEILIRTPDDALDLMAGTQSEYIILHKHNFEPQFFDLSTKVLGEVLQKFANYHIKLAIIGDYSEYKSKSLKDFIYESNKNGEYLFVNSIDEVVKIWKI